MPYRFLSQSMPWLRRLSSALPSSCALCGMEGNRVLCHACEIRYFSHAVLRCRQCGIGVSHEQDVAQCGSCLRQPPAFDATIVAGDYSPPFDHLILALKFGNRLALAPVFARLLRDAILRRADTCLPDFIGIVPLSRERLIERGFNQSLEIARPFAQATAIPLHADLLQRTRHTLPQSLLPPSSRQQNVKNAFIPQSHAVELIKNRRIAILDDVMTTGDTMNEIARLLKRHGATHVTNLVVARTPAH